MTHDGPRGLAIETSGRTGSVAVSANGVVLAEDQFPHGLQHAAGLVPMIDRLCKSVEWGPRDIQEIYVSAGPGSFTGLRVGITVAKTLAFASGAKLVAVPSVEVLVHNAPVDAKEVIIVLDAKRDQIFTARFSRKNSGGWHVEEPAHLDSLTAMLSRSARPVYLLGDGIPFHTKFLPPADPSIALTHEESWRARASVVTEIGFAMAKRHQFTEPDRLTPVYVRKPEAEEKWEAQQAAK